MRLLPRKGFNFQHSQTHVSSKVREEQKRGAHIVHSDLEQGCSYGLLQTRGVEIEHVGSQQQGLQGISEEFIYANKICLRNFSCVKQQLEMMNQNKTHNKQLMGYLTRNKAMNKLNKQICISRQNEVADVSLDFPVNLEPSSSLRATDGMRDFLSKFHEMTSQNKTHNKHLMGYSTRNKAMTKLKKQICVSRKNEVIDVSLDFPVNLEPSSSLRATDEPSAYLTSWDFNAQKRITTPPHANYTYFILVGMNDDIDKVYMHIAPFGHVGSLSLPFTILNQIQTEVKVGFA
nr:hypothetical protein [Tanacetum cinerariifolium]